MCFSPQRRAIFQHLNFKKWSGADVFCTFSLQNVLLATAACNFWFLLWPHDSAPAALTSLLFDSPDTRIIGKTQRFATSLTFGADVSSFFWLSRYCIFFLLTLLHLLTLLSSDFTSSICFSSAFQLSILSEVYYLNFLRPLFLETPICFNTWEHDILNPQRPGSGTVLTDDLDRPKRDWSVDWLVHRSQLRYLQSLGLAHLILWAEKWLHCQLCEGRNPLKFSTCTPFLAGVYR